LRRNSLLKHVTEERQKQQEDEEEDVSSYWMTLRKKRILKTERGSIRVHCLEKWP
jgi:hypothetical protein